MRRLPLVAALLLFAAAATYAVIHEGLPAETAASAVLPVQPIREAPPPQRDIYGLLPSDEVVSGTIARNETLAELLTRHGTSYRWMERLVANARPVFDVRYMRPGKHYRLYVEDDSVRQMVYAHSATRYVVLDLAAEGGPTAYERTRPTQTVQRRVEGTVTGSLWTTLERADAPAELAFKLAEVYAWQIDFYHLQRGDRFTVVYEEERLDGEAVGIGRIVTARFDHADAPYYAFWFETPEHADYYDERGGSLRKAFLRSPLEYGRVTSAYNPRRFHPILKRVRPHLGTDYAAPHGTPVRTVGDGVVLEASYSRGNGNYVKVRHNATYTTQYLHFSRIADGIEPGTRVRQGETIGYVGSTGLATGPHTCFRFWKDGRQVDPRKEEIPPAHPVPQEHHAAYLARMAELAPLLDGEAVLPGPRLAATPEDAPDAPDGYELPFLTPTTALL